MRRIFCAAVGAALLFSVAIQVAASAEPISVTVDCGRGQTIATGLMQGDIRKPLVINIRGTCNESVVVDRANVTLRGSPTATVVSPDPSRDVFTIDADGVTLQDLTIMGGRNGIRQEHAVRFMVSNCTIDGSGSDGMVVFVGDVRLLDSTIQNAGGNGISIQRAGSAALTRSNVLDSTARGVNATGNAFVNLSDSTVARSGAYGVFLDNGSHGTVDRSTIDGSGSNPARAGEGLYVSRSDANVNDSTISGSRTNGVLVVAGGTASIARTTVSGNGEHGINGHLGTTLVLNGDTISENANSGVVGYAHSTVQISGSRILNNRGGAGISMNLGSKLLLLEPTTVANGNFGALWCDDGESSAWDLNLLDAGGDTVFCTGY